MYKRLRSISANMFWSAWLLLILPRALGMDLPSAVSNRGCFCGYDSFPISDRATGQCKTVRIKVLYPTLVEEETANRKRSGRPVVVFFGGALMESNRYQWLGERLVRECGVVFVSTEEVANHNGSPMLLSLGGGRMKKSSPTEGTTNLFNKLKELNKTGRLAGRMDLDKVVVGGHSWGGRVTLIDAGNDEFFPNVVGAFVYGANAIAFPEEGLPPGAALPLAGKVPTMLMVGTHDARMKMIGYQYNTTFSSPTEPIWRTFTDSFDPERKRYYVELDEFNHMSMVYPEDGAIPSHLYDGPSRHSKEEMTEELWILISLFVKVHAMGDDDADLELRNRLLGGRDPYVNRAVVRGLPRSE